MKARKFFAFVAVAAMLFGAVGCAKDDAGDSESAVITVTPDSVATTLEGGDCPVSIVTNGTWSATCATEGITITPAQGSGNAEVVITIPATNAARNFTVEFKAVKTMVVEGASIPTSANASVMVYQNPNGDTSIATNVGAIRALLKAMNPTSTATAVTEEIAAMTLTGILVAEPDGNLSNNKMIVVQDDNDQPGSGLTIYCNDNVNDDHAIGDIVTVNLAKAQVALFSGLLQLSGMAASDVKITGSTEVTPIDVTLSNILQYESQYVKLSNVSPVQSFVGQAWNDTGSTRNVDFVTFDGQSFIIRVSTYASFKDEIIPDKMGSISGIVGLYNGTLQFWPQYASDIALDQDAPEVEYKESTIADIDATGGYIVNNAWVVATYANGYILTDESGAKILAYFTTPLTTIPAEGTVVNVKGLVTEYAALRQFKDAEVEFPDVEAKSVDHGTAVAMTGAELDEYVTAPTIKYVSYEGKLKNSKDYYDVYIEGASTAQGSIQYPTEELKATLSTLNGKYVKVTGYITGANQGKFIQTMILNVEEATDPTPDPVLPTVTYTNVTGALADYSGTYLFGYLNDTTLWIADSVTTGSSGQYISYTTIANFTGNVVESDTAYFFTVAKVEGTNYYSLLYDGKYVGWTSSNYISFSETAPTAADTNYQWDFVAEGGVLKVKLVALDGSSVRYLQCNTNSGQERFSIYKGTQKDILLFKSGEFSVLPEPTPTVKTMPYVESFASNKGDFTINNVLLPEGSNYIWKWDSYNNVGYMKASAYFGSSAKASESWLVSPEVSLADATAPELKFSHTHKYAGTPSEELTLWVKEQGADWTQVAIPNYAGNSDFTFVDNAIDLTAYVGKTIQVAFKYVSSTAAAGTWQVNNFSIAEKGSTPTPEPEPEPTPTPTPTPDGTAASVTFSTLGYANGASLDGVTVAIDANASCTFAKNNGSTAPAYYNTGTAARLYASNTLVVNSTKTIKQIKFTFDTSKDEENLSATGYDVATYIWTGESNSITFTQGGSSGHSRIQKIEVIYAE